MRGSRYQRIQQYIADRIRILAAVTRIRTGDFINAKTDPLGAASFNAAMAPLLGH